MHCIKINLMKYYNFLSHIIVGIFSVLLVACQEQHPSDFSTKKNPEQNFNSITTEAHFRSQPLTKQYKFLINVIKTPYKNQKEVEEWLLIKLKTLCKHPNRLDEQTARVLNDELYQSEYYMAAKKMADLSLHSTYTKTFKNINGIAGAILARHYNFLKEKDSLAKYLAILEQGIKTDTTQWLKLSYFSNKANLADLNGQYFKAAVNYQNAIEITSPQDKKNLSTLYQNLATMYLNIDYLEKASEFINKAINLVGIENIALDQLNTIGIILMKTGNVEKAENIYNRALIRAKEKGLRGIMAQTYSNLGNFKKRQGDFQKALTFYKASDAICIELNIGFGLLVNQINRSEVYFLQKKLDLAIAQLLDAEVKAAKFNNIKINIELYEFLSKSFKAVGKQSLSDKYFRKYIENKQSFTGDLPRSVIIQWELEKEREKSSINNNQYELLLQKEKAGQYLIAFIMSLFLLILSVVFFYRNKRNAIYNERLKLEKQKISHDLELKSKELLIDSLKNASIQNTKDWMKQELQQIINDLPESHHSKFSNLKIKLNTRNSKSFIDEFETRFTSVYEEFFTNIKKIAPDLTPNEIRLCALMRLNISTKEIAVLTNRTVGTIDNARSNIRKKLKLEDQVILQQFLLEL